MIILFYSQCLLAQETPELVRFASLNASLYRSRDGELASALRGGADPYARGIAEIVQNVRPDVLLINEFDYDKAEQAVQTLCAEYLQISQNGHSPILYPFWFTAPVNTGVLSGVDFDGDGKISLPQDGFGFGRHAGQYGMVVLSRFPIQTKSTRTFQKFLWNQMPGALLPTVPGTGRNYYSDQALSVFRLSSKSHWDVPISIGTQVIHVLAAHPTPPAFEGPEQRNGRRNHDEIRLWADYIEPARSAYLLDDSGQRGGLPANSHFVILGDYNADPFDGTTVNQAIDQLLKHPLVNCDLAPSSRGGVESSELLAGKNLSHRGPAQHDTAKFNHEGPGNLRVDYALPSRTLTANNSGVFWPSAGEPGADVVKVTDHRLVWIDIKVKP